MSAGTWAIAADKDGDVVGGGVRAGVPRPQGRGQELLTVVAPDADRVEPEPVLERRRRLLFLASARSRRWRRRRTPRSPRSVPATREAGSPPSVASAPRRAADPCPRGGPAATVGCELAQCPPQRRRQRDRPQDLSGGAGRRCRDGLPTIGEQHGQIDQDPTPVMDRGEPPPGQSLDSPPSARPCPRTAGPPRTRVRDHPGTVAGDR